MGRGQKLCRVEIFISPASTTSKIPGSRLMRMPWLSSAYSKPRSRISRNMARPSVWRCEFQQVESEYIQSAGKVVGLLPHAKKKGRVQYGFRPHPAREVQSNYRSAYRAASIAEKRATFSLRRRRALGFSKCR